jgi:hypothetical protein
MVAEPEFRSREEKVHPAPVLAEPAWMRITLFLLVWSLWLPARAFARFLQGTWRILRTNRTRQLVTLGIFSIVILGSIKVVPMIYGRYAITYEADHLARTYLSHGDAEIRQTLVRTAFYHGYTDVIEQPEAFTVEADYDGDGIFTCSIIIDLRQQIDWYGMFKLPVRIQAIITKPADSEVIKPRRLEENLIIG